LEAIRGVRMRSKSNRSLGLPRLVTVALVLGILTFAPLPVGRTVEAWSEESTGRPEARHSGAQAVRSGGVEAVSGAARANAPTSLAVDRSPPPRAAEDYGSSLDTRRTNLLALLIGMLAVLVALRWHLSVRGRQHYPRS